MIDQLQQLVHGFKTPLNPQQAKKTLVLLEKCEKIVKQPNATFFDLNYYRKLLTILIKLSIFSPSLTIEVLSSHFIDICKMSFYGQKQGDKEAVIKIKYQIILDLLFQNSQKHFLHIFYENNGQNTSEMMEVSVVKQGFTLKNLLNFMKKLFDKDKENSASISAVCCQWLIIKNSQILSRAVINTSQSHYGIFILLTMFIKIFHQKIGKHMINRINEIFIKFLKRQQEKNQPALYCFILLVLLEKTIIFEEFFLKNLKDSQLLCIHSLIQNSNNSQMAVCYSFYEALIVKAISQKVLDPQKNNLKLLVELSPFQKHSLSQQGQIEQVLEQITSYRILHQTKSSSIRKMFRYQLEYERIFDTISSSIRKKFKIEFLSSKSLIYLMLLTYSKQKILFELMNMIGQNKEDINEEIQYNWSYFMRDIFMISKFKTSLKSFLQLVVSNQQPLSTMKWCKVIKNFIVQKENCKQKINFQIMKEFQEILQKILESKYTFSQKDLKDLLFDLVFEKTQPKENSISNFNDNKYIDFSRTLYERLGIKNELKQPPISKNFISERERPWVYLTKHFIIFLIKNQQQNIPLSHLKQLFSIYYDRTNDLTTTKLILNHRYLIIWSMLVCGYRRKVIFDQIIKAGLSRAQLSSLFNIREGLVKQIVQFWSDKNIQKLRAELYSRKMKHEEHFASMPMSDLLLSQIN